MRQFSHEQQRTHQTNRQSNNPSPVQSAARRSLQPIDLDARSVQLPRSHTPRARNDPRIRILRNRARLHRAHQQRPHVHRRARIPHPRDDSARRSTHRSPRIPSPRRDRPQSRIDITHPLLSLPRTCLPIARHAHPRLPRACGGGGSAKPRRRGSCANDSPTKNNPKNKTASHERGVINPNFKPRFRTTQAQRRSP